MGIPTLISTHTADDDASLDITADIDSTYDEYMFVCTDIGPATDAQNFTFQASTDGGSNYGVVLTTTFFYASHSAADATAFTYYTGGDLAQSTGEQRIADAVGNAADESVAGILHLFSPSNTTYVKHFYCRTDYYHNTNTQTDAFIAGYFNTTTAIDAIRFKFDSGNFDGVIQMYGIS